MDRWSYAIASSQVSIPSILDANPICSNEACGNGIIESYLVVICQRKQLINERARQRSAHYGAHGVRRSVGHRHLLRTANGNRPRSRRNDNGHYFITVEAVPGK